MKKKIIMLFAIGCIFASGILIGGCRVPNIISGSTVDFYKPETYSFSGKDLMFVPVRSSAIDCGDGIKNLFIEYVKVDDKTVWMECFTKDGYYARGTSFSQEMNAGGSVKVYDGSINELLKKYDQHK